MWYVAEPRVTHLCGYGVEMDNSHLQLPQVGVPLGDWADDAACKSMDIEIFYPKSGRRPTQALATCRECPVRSECLEYALEAHQHWGVWGGMTERQRFDEKRRRRNP